MASLAAAAVSTHSQCACGAVKATAAPACAACSAHSRLGVGAADDFAEREAEHTAERTLAASRRKQAPVDAKRTNGARSRVIGQAPRSVEHALAQAGSPLPRRVRDDMEGRFGHDFSRVRIHAGAAADRSAGDIAASAYTVGDDIVFAAGLFQPGSHAGQRLLAHELAHVVQARHDPGGARVVRRAPAPGIPDGIPGGGDGAPGITPVPSVPGSTPRPVGRGAAAPAPASAVCPACACAPDHVTRIEAARRKAEKVLAAAATQLQSPSPSTERIFERAFGAGSATPENVASAADRYRNAAAFLGSSKVSDPPGSGTIHCDLSNTTDTCAGGATAFYDQGNVVVCGTEPAQQMLDPPQVPTVYRMQGTPGSTVEKMEQVPDPGATELAQHASDAAFATRLTAVMAHEAIHHVVQPGIVDVYSNERLFRFLGGQSKKDAVDLSPLALQNPDSLVLFAFRGFVAEGGKLPESEAALASSEKLSGRLSIRPVLGRRRAELAVALAEEAIGQASGQLSLILSEVKSVQGGPSDWSRFPNDSQQLIASLVRLGNETDLGQPDAAALARLQTLSDAFARLGTAVHDKKLVVGRRFLKDQPAKRIEIAVPDWRAFRKKPVAEQVTLVVTALLSEEADIAHLDDFVLDLARTRGGMGKL